MPTPLPSTIRHAQFDLGLVERGKENPNADWLVEFLGGRGWMTAPDILRAAGLPVTDSNRKRIADAAIAAAPRIIGHQQGYCCVKYLSAEEYEHWRNEALKDAKTRMRRVILTDRFYYGRQGAK